MWSGNCVSDKGRGGNVRVSMVHIVDSHFRFRGPVSALFIGGMPMLLSGGTHRSHLST